MLHAQQDLEALGPLVAISPVITSACCSSGALFAMRLNVGSLDLSYFEDLEVLRLSVVLDVN